MVWAESIKWGVKTPAILHGGVKEDVEKQWEEQKQNEEHQQMRRWQPTTRKLPQRFSQAKEHRWKLLTFNFKKILQN